MLPLRNIAVAILLIGFVVGGWRVWTLRGQSIDDAAVNSGVTSVVLLTSKGKSIWIQHQVIAYNSRHDKARVEVKFVEDRDAMTGILYGRQRPALWCPDSTLWDERLNNLWTAGHSGSLIGQDEADFRVLMRSPLVFLTTSRKAAFLQPILSGPQPWEQIDKLASGESTSPWGGFRLGMPTPSASNTGILTLGLAAVEYARLHNGGNLTTALLNDPGFTLYIQHIAQASRVYAGPYELTEAFRKDNGIADVIVIPESAALDAVRHDNRLSVIYPQPTLDENNAVSIVDGPWCTQAQLAVARDFLGYISRPDAINGLAQYDMRPPMGIDESDIDDELTRYRKQGLQPAYTSTDVPPYAVLNALTYKWSHVQHG